MPNAASTPISLTLSDDSSLESVLSDIPFFCVGVMTFGIFTFVLFLKRVNLLAIYIYISSFLAFTAAILDLGQVLASDPNSASGKTDFVSRLVIAREVGLALSLGFSYLFLWHLVAQSFRQEVASHEDTQSATRPTRSAAWERWGLFGLLLKWSLLSLSVSISILQIIWRVSAPNAQFGTVYIADATIEVVVSALFILKLILNVFLSPLTPWWRPMQTYIAPLVALLISAGLGLGNLVALAFSETTLGRFLRAIEFYILILFVLITAFYEFKTSNNPTTSLPRSNRISSFFVLPSMVRNSPIHISTPSATNSDIVFVRHSVLAARRSIASTMSKLSARVLSRSADPRENAERIWDYDKELGLAADDLSPAQSKSVSPDAVFSSRLPIGIDSKVVNEVPVSEEQPPSIRRPWTEDSISSYYGMEGSVDDLLPPTALGREPDSPIYGLNGFISKSRVPDATTTPQSNLSFDELLRQQIELDKSIAVLRLYSSGASTSIPDSPDVPPVVVDSLPPKASESPKPQSTSQSMNSSLTRKPESVSNRSDFSLSMFPAPPAVDTEPSATSRRLDRFAGRVLTQLQGISSADIASDAIPGKVVEGEKPSLPVSPSPSDNNVKFDSAGTQYDVTAFIGALTKPTSGSIGSPALSNVQSEDESTPEIIPVDLSITQNVRPMILASSATLSLPTSDKASTINPKDETRPRQTSVTLRPLLLGSSSQVVPMILPSSTMVPIGSRRMISKAGIRLNNPRRPNISGPTLPPEDGRGDQAPGAFEHPRPPPFANSVFLDEKKANRV